MKKFVAILLTVILALGLVACSGGGSEGGESTPAVKGEQQSWGQLSVFVPEGFELKGGSITGVDDDDPAQCSIRPAESLSLYDYFWIMATTADSAASSVEITKETNSAADVTAKVGETEWTGCNYVYEALSGKVDCGIVYATISDVTYQVNYCGHAIDSPEMTAILGSIAAAE